MTTNTLRQWLQQQKRIDVFGCMFSLFTLIFVVRPMQSEVYNITIVVAEGCGDGMEDELVQSKDRAMDRIQTLQFPPGYSISSTMLSYCSQKDALLNLDEIFKENKTNAVIGISSYEFHNAFGAFAEVYRTLYVASNSYIPHSGDSRIIAMHNSFQETASALSNVLQYFQWQNTFIFSTDDPYWVAFSSALFIELTQKGFIVRNRWTLRTPINESNVADILLEAKANQKGVTGSETWQVKAIVLCMSVEEQVQVLIEERKLGLLYNHAFFTIFASPYDQGYDKLHNISVASSKTSKNYNFGIEESVFILTPVVTNLINGTGSNRKKRQATFAQPGDVHSLYDAIVLIGLSVQKALTGSTIDYDAVVKAASGMSFEGTQGDVIFDNSGERRLPFEILDFNPDSQKFETVIQLRLDTQTFTWKVEKVGTVNWPNNVVIPPDSCFNSAESCRYTESFKIEYIGAILGPVLVLALILGVAGFLVRRRFVRKEMLTGNNRVVIFPEDLTFMLNRKGQGSASKGSSIGKNSAFSKPDLLKGSGPNTSLASLHELTDYSQTARYGGDMVHVKDLKIKTKSLILNGKMLDTLKILRDLRHENVNAFVGFLCDPEHPSTITEYGNRGSLEDILANENLKLDWDFKLSLLTDLVRGLRYIHGCVLHHHGNLKSTNCIVDSRWVLKLTDYGLSLLYGPYKQKREQEARQLLWTAPEMLRDENVMFKGTAKADIFSLGIIMQEIVLRLPPYGMLDMRPEEIIAKVKSPPPLLRPSVSKQAAQPNLVQVIKQCWFEMPDLRPDINSIYQLCKTMNGGKKMNIVDTMFRMLEKYSNDLEEIVAERTVQLEEEKKKTDQLLYRMLPASVADSLKIGNPVEAETFNEVTIYFSDIVGFTTISAMSTPMQVVQLLNDLYTMFDATIDIYDVYKVETIGDAYMCVSGLPIRNGNRHAGEIGTMALHLLSECGSFVIRHMPDVPLRLRIGLHSGSCVAGVVGLAMPRYCLFGDTVNTASRMESTGSPFRVHLSEYTKNILDVLGGYKVDYRGEVELKGKGIHRTYWLMGKEGFTRKLPDVPTDTGLDKAIVKKLSKQADLKNLNQMLSKDGDSAIGSSPEKKNSTDSSKSLTSSPTKATPRKVNVKSSSPPQRHSPQKENVRKVDVIVEKRGTPPNLDKKQSHPSPKSHKDFRIKKQTANKRASDSSDHSIVSSSDCHVALTESKDKGLSPVSEV